MKRYNVLGEKFDFDEYEKGDIIFYDDFESLILRRIKELETDKYIDSEHKKQRIKELKNLLK